MIESGSGGFQISNPKKYISSKSLFKTKCIDANGIKYLKKDKWYDVIQENDTTYLIRFNSGATSNYKKSRFVGKF